MHSKHVIPNMWTCLGLYFNETKQSTTYNTYINTINALN